VAVQLVEQQAQWTYSGRMACSQHENLLYRYYRYWTYTFVFVFIFWRAKRMALLDLGPQDLSCKSGAPGAKRTSTSGSHASPRSQQGAPWAVTRVGVGAGAGGCWGGGGGGQKPKKKAPTAGRLGCVCACAAAGLNLESEKRREKKRQKRHIFSNRQLTGPMYV
jgi:hypothetical protein